MSDVITEVYGGLAKITFKPGKHVYTVDVPSRGIKDLWQPGVTTIIGMKDKSGALVPWAVEQMTARVKYLLSTDTNPAISKELLMAVLKSAQETWRETRDNAGQIGTAVHNYLELELKHLSGLGPPPDLPKLPKHQDAVDNAISAGMKFFNEHHIRLIQAEAPRWSATYGYIGTGDAIAWVDGELTVLDYKTSKRLYDTVYLQLAAYQFAYEEEFPDQKITKRLGINVGRDGVLTTGERDNSTFETDFTTFRALLNVWRWDRANQGKYSKPVPAVVGRIN